MVHDSEYFKKRYKLFIRFIKENNLYGEYRRIRTKGQALHMIMVATDVRTKPKIIQRYSDFKLFYKYSKEDVRTKITKLKPKWKKIIIKLENE